MLIIWKLYFTQWYGLVIGKNDKGEDGYDCRKLLFQNNQNWLRIIKKSGIIA